MKQIDTIGCDIGTTNSCVAIYINGNVEIIPDFQTGSRIIPSYVTFTDTEKLVGEASKNVAAMYPKSTIYDVKRLIGRRFSDEIVQKVIKLWSFDVKGVENDKL